jgi:hypothetical protein
MALKKTELYRGFSIFTEAVRAGTGIAERARGTRIGCAKHVQSSLNLHHA